MNTIFAVSNLLLWIFMIFQFVCIIVLGKLVVNFLNRFRISNTGATPLQLTTGTQAPVFRVMDQNGQAVALNETQGKPTLLLFTNDTCPICQSLIPVLPMLQQHLNMRCIVFAPEMENPPQKLIPDGVHFIRSNQVFEDYLHPGAPTMILIDANRYVIGNEILRDSRQLEILVRHHMQMAS